MSSQTWREHLACYQREYGVAASELAEHLASAEHNSPQPSGLDEEGLADRHRHMHQDGDQIASPDELDLTRPEPAQVVVARLSLPVEPSGLAALINALEGVYGPGCSIATHGDNTWMAVVRTVKHA